MEPQHERITFRRSAFEPAYLCTEVALPLGIATLLVAMCSSLIAAEASQSPGQRVAVVLSSSEDDREIAPLIDALKRNGYTALTVHNQEIFRIPLAEFHVRMIGNALWGLPDKTDVLLIAKGSLALGSGKQATLGASPGVSLASLAKQLARLERSATTLFLDVVSRDSVGEVSRVVAETIRPVAANLHVIVAQQASPPARSWSSTIPLLCGALTYDRDADWNRNGAISPPQLTAFLGRRSSGNVSAVFFTAKNAQEPLRSIRLLPPASMSDAIENVSKEVVDVVRAEAASVVVIPKFKEASDDVIAKPSRAHSGPLASYIVECIRRQVRKSLDKTVSLAYGQPDVKVPAGSVTATVEGTIHVDAKQECARLAFDGRIVLQRGSDSRTLALHSCRAPLTSDEAGMTGRRNMKLTAGAIAMGIPWDIPDVNAPPELAPHPMLAAKWPLRVYLESATRGRLEHRFSDDKRRMYVNLQPGEEYVIVVENHTDRNVFLRLLVDGRNTLPDRTDDSTDYAPAQYVSLPRARCWFCEARQTYHVSGFYHQLDTAESRWKSFSIASINDLLLPGEHRDELGIITAAFYTAVENTKSSMGSQPRYATQMGSEKQGRVEVYRGEMGPGALIGDAPINIHYGFGNE